METQKIINRIFGKCRECGKQLTEEDIYGHDCEVGVFVQSQEDLTKEVWERLRNGLK